MRPLALALVLLALACLHCGRKESASQPPPSPAAPARTAPATPAAPPPLAAVRDRLLPALYPPASASTLLAREDLEGVSTALVLASGDTVRGIPASARQAWGRPPEGLFASALGNLERDVPLEFRPLRLSLGIELLAAQDERPFAASHVLLLDRHPQALGPHGALVAVPTRHTLLCYPIRDQGVTLAVQFLPVVARRLHAAGPGPVTDSIYLYRNKRFVRIPYRLDTKGFALSPPPELMQVLREVPPASKP